MLGIAAGGLLPLAGRGLSASRQPLGRWAVWAASTLDLQICNTVH